MASTTPASDAAARILTRVPIQDNQEHYRPTPLQKGSGPGMIDLIRILVGPPEMSPEDLVLRVTPEIRILGPDGDPRKDGIYHVELRMVVTDILNLGHGGPYDLFGYLCPNDAHGLGLKAEGDYGFQKERLLLLRGYSFRERSGELVMSWAAYRVLRQRFAENSKSWHNPC